MSYYYKQHFAMKEKPLRRIQKIMGIIALLAVVMSMMVSTPTPTYAGWNGQQIFVRSAECCVLVDSIRLSGLNQNNRYVSYSASFRQATGYDVWNWWWKRSIKVELTLLVLNPGYSRPVTCYIDVPTSQSSDWVRVLFNRNGCWKG